MRIKCTNYAVFSGLILVPNGKLLGQYLGDRYPAEEAMQRAASGGIVRDDRWWDDEDERDGGPGGRFYGYGQEDRETKLRRKLEERKKLLNMTDEEMNYDLAGKLGLPIDPDLHQSHPWGVFFTVLGTVLLDFDADSCQSPSRAYLLDVTLPGN